MQCLPLRGIPCEIRPPQQQQQQQQQQHEHASLAASHCPWQVDSDLDTSLDDEFAIQQQQQGEATLHASQRHHADECHSAHWSAPAAAHVTTLAELAASTAPPSESNSAGRQYDTEVECADGMGHTEEDEEEARSHMTLPAPTPHRDAELSRGATPALRHASPGQVAPLFTPPPRQPPSHRHLTSSHLPDPSALPSSSSSLLLDYKGTPIDMRMRRNVLASSPAAPTNSAAFREAAAASLSHTSPLSMLHSLASPVKSRHMLQLEAQVAALAVSPAHPHLREYDASAYADVRSESDPVSLSHVDATASDMHVEQSTVEEADDAVEEIGGLRSEGDEDGAHMHEEEEEEEEEWSGPHYASPRQELAAHPPKSIQENDASGLDALSLFSPIAAHSARVTPFVSPAAVRPAPHSQPSRSARAVRSAPPSAPVTPLHLLSCSPSVVPTVPCGLAPASQEWSAPRELSQAKAAERQLLQHSRVGLHRTALDKKRHEASMLATVPLPKISPPTLEQWQRERAPRPARPTTAGAAPSRTRVQSGLQLLKSKAAAKRSSSAATPASSGSTSISAPRPAPTAASFPTSTAHRVPLAPLPSHTLNVNPWASGEESEATEPMHTPSKRSSGAVTHTPVPILVSSEKEQPSSLSLQVDLPLPEPAPPSLHALPPPLSPPAHPAQTYRALVNGVHVLPPALRWVAPSEAPPRTPRAVERMHANLRYLTTAYQYAD